MSTLLSESLSLGLIIGSFGVCDGVYGESFRPD